MVRSGGELRQTQWDVALARAVEGLQAVHQRDPDSVAVLGSGQQTNEAAYALGKVARGGFGTRNYDANTTLCMASAVTAYYQTFGSDAPPCTYADISDADRHVVWGANPAVAHPVLFRWVQQSADEDGVEIIVVDPVRSRLQRTPNITSHLTRGRTSHWLAPSLPVSSKQGGSTASSSMKRPTGSRTCLRRCPMPMTRPTRPASRWPRWTCLSTRWTSRRSSTGAWASISTFRGPRPHGRSST